MKLPLKLSGLYRASLVIVLGLLIGLFGCTSTQAVDRPVLSGNLPLKVPGKIGVGDGFEVLAGPIPAVDGTSIDLVTLGSYGPKVYQSIFKDGLARFLIPGEDTKQAGQVSLVATSGAARSEAKMLINPGPAVEPVKPLVGSRSIPADQQHWSMVVVVPFDIYGNPVADNTMVSLKVLHPGNNLEKKEVPVKNLLAWARIYSGTKAGQTVVTTMVGNVAGPEDLLLEFAGLPVSFSLEADPPNLPADGRALLILRTSVLKDKYGNVLPDGTRVTYQIHSPGEEEVRSLPAYTIGGVAQTPLQAPVQPGIIQAIALVAGVESQPLQVTFTAGPAAGNFPIVVTVNKANQATNLEAGPLLGQLGQFVPDGTPVIFNISDATGKKQVFRVLAKNGRATLDLQEINLNPGNYTAQARVGSGEGIITFTILAR